MDALEGTVILWPAMSAEQPLVLLLDDADTFRAVEGTCLRRERCRLGKASFDQLAKTAREERPALILASCRDAASRERTLAMLSDRELAGMPVLVLDFSAGTAPRPARGRTRRGAPLELLSARRLRSGGPDFAELDARLDAAVTRLVPQLCRRSDRLAVDLTVSCQGPGLRSSLRTKDISHTGIFLKTDRPLAPGSRFGISLHLDASETIGGLCEVVRQVRKGDTDLIPGIGVRFIDLDDSGRERLRRFVTTRPRGARLPRAAAARASRSGH